MAQMENSSDNINKLVEHQFQVGVVAFIENDAKINNKSFPLTFLDIPLAGPIYVKRLFFYKFPFSTSHFYQTTLPYLKRSLSLTLQSFFPLAGNLLCPPPPHKPFIQCTNEDSVAFTVVESSLDFNLLASNNPKSINDLRTLAPNLVGKAMHHDRDSGDDTLVFPILALKATVFANRGVCIAINYCHVMDDRSCGQFMKSWSSLCGTIIRNGEEVESTLLDKYLPPPPCFDRGVLKDPKGLESIFLNDYFGEWQTFKDKVVSQSQTGSLRAEEEEEYVKATIVFGRKETEGMKRFALNELKKSNRSEAPQYLSSFVVTCAFLWSTLVKTKHRDEEEEEEEEEDCIRFPADVRERLEYPIAENYFGNCITRCHATLKRKELKGEGGFVNAARVIDKAVNDMKEEPFRGAENWKSTFIKLFVLGNSGLLVAGSHKFGVYDTDFGFGRPVKVEMLHSFRVMSIAETGDTEKGGIEFGMVFRKAEFQSFQDKLQQGLQVFA